MLKQWINRLSVLCLKPRLVLILWTAISCNTLWNIESSWALDWKKETVDTQGAKPAMALDAGGNPVIAFMLESFSGFVKFSRKENGIWMTDEVSAGYFYGPLDITVDSAGEPVINYHDHTTEDQTIAIRSNQSWQVNNIPNPGHDGWDNTIRYSPDGTLHTLTTDPSGFGGQGLEFASRINGAWQVEQVGTGPIMYAEGISMEFDSENRAHISYHNSRTQQLFYGVRESSGWKLSVVDEGPEAGMFSSIALSKMEEPHISYIGHNEDGIPEVRLASLHNGAWSIETVDVLEDLTVGFLFARNATNLLFDLSGVPTVVYTDETKIKFAQKNAGQWQMERIDTIENIEGSRFGQQVDVSLGADGTWHVVSFDVTSQNPLYGNILYYQAAGSTAVLDWKQTK